MGLFEFGNKKKEKEEPTLLNEIMEKVGYPFTVLDRDMTPGQLMAFYKESLERGRREGFTPAIVGAEDENRLLLECFDDFLKEDQRQGVGEMLAKMGDGKAFLENMEKEFCKWNQMPEDGLFTTELLGEMEAGEAINEFSAIYDFNPHKRRLRPCALVEVPTRNPWEVVVYLPFGGWNDCLAPWDMAAVCKYWYDQYGAIPATITSDTLEFYLENPVKEEEAMELAKEHFLFCTDRVFQGTRTDKIGEVADCLRKSKVWYFWWD